MSRMSGLQEKNAMRERAHTTYYAMHNKLIITRNNRKLELILESRGKTSFTTQTDKNNNRFSVPDYFYIFEIIRRNTVALSYL